MTVVDCCSFVSVPPLPAFLCNAPVAAVYVALLCPTPGAATWLPLPSILCYTDSPLLLYSRIPPQQPFFTHPPSSAFSGMQRPTLRPSPPPALLDSAPAAAIPTHIYYVVRLLMTIIPNR